MNEITKKDLRKKLNQLANEQPSVTGILLASIGQLLIEKKIITESELEAMKKRMKKVVINNWMKDEKGLEALKTTMEFNQIFGGKS